MTLAIDHQEGLAQVIWHIQATFVDEVIGGTEVQSLIPKITVETNSSLTQFQSRVVWVDSSQASHESFIDLSEPVTDFETQGRKLDQKFANLCALADVDAGSTKAAIKALSASEVVSLQKV